MYYINKHNLLIQQIHFYFQNELELYDGNGNDERYHKEADDRYFILTFVLCGCIAGILLAVVVIYLIRRNSRSKAKLQQIASVQETGEAASKDYQVK